MANTAISVSGRLVGYRIDPKTGSRMANIVHIDNASKSKGPAINAFILIEESNHTPRARYISWINYFDIEYANIREPRAWSLVEPAEPYMRAIMWNPYGWPGAVPVPTIGDSVLEEMGLIAKQ